MFVCLYVCMYVCLYIYLYECMYVLGLCGFNLPVRFWSVLIAKAAVSVFSVRFFKLIAASVAVGFDQQYRQINTFLLLGQHNAFISYD